MKPGLLVVFLLFLWNPGTLASTGIIFELQVGQEKCFQEDLPSDTVVLGEFKLAASFNTQTLIRVWDFTGAEVWRTENGVEGTFAFTTEHPGEISICFLDNPKPGASVPAYSKRQVTFALKTGVEAKDYTSIAKKDDLKPLELEMLKLEDVVEELNADFRYFKNREGDHRVTNESTNSRVLWLSLFSVTTLVALGVFQIYYLKRYFQQKKLI